MYMYSQYNPNWSQTTSSLYMGQEGNATLSPIKNTPMLNSVTVKKVCSHSPGWATYMRKNNNSAASGE